jgi:hypothetical protein
VTVAAAVAPTAVAAVVAEDKYLENSHMTISYMAIFL